MEQSRLKSKVAWVSILSVVMILMRAYGIYEKIGLTEEVFKTIVDSVLGAMVIFGILNDPTSKTSF